MALIIGVPTEIKTGERRIALVPHDCARLIALGHTIHIQSGAGLGAGFTDDEYVAAGCSIQPDAASLYGAAQKIIKVKEPLDGDLALLTPRHSLFCYLHLAGNPGLEDKLNAIGCGYEAFETVIDQNGGTPLLAPMSAVAGRLSVQLGTHYLHTHQGGRGVLLGGTSFAGGAGVVTVIGAGIAGTEAALLAAGMGAQVNVLDLSFNKLTKFKGNSNVSCYESTPAQLEELLPQTDLLIGAVYVVGQKAPTVVNAEQMKLLPKGAVTVDIAIDQGGCFETSRPTTHMEPTFELDGIIHCGITNLPAAAPRTASEMLSKVISQNI